MAKIAVYSWAQITVPSALQNDHLTQDTYGNMPGGPKYSADNPSWVGQTYTYLGGAPTVLKIDDDDGLFQDSYVETGTAGTLREPVTLNGQTFPTGSVVENEFALVDASGTEVWILRINGVNVGMVPPAGTPVIPAGVTFTPVLSRDGATADNYDGISSTAAYAQVLCFAATTRIATETGLRAAGGIVAGDRILTRDAALQPVLWAGRRRVDLAHGPPAARPVIFSPGAFGHGRPAATVTLSPQHRVLLEGGECCALFGVDAVFAPACGLTGLPGVGFAPPGGSIDYVHFLLPRHHILTAEGMPVESLYPGPQAFSGLQTIARSDVERVLAGLPRDSFATLARPTVTRRQAGDWVASRLAGVR